MAIKRIEKDGVVTWQVYLNIRSKTDPTIREQKRLLDLKTEKAAVSEEKRLYRELIEKIKEREGAGSTWESVLLKWELAVRSDPSKPYVDTTIADNLASMRKWTAPWLPRPAAEVNRADGRDVLRALIEYRKSKGYQKHIKSTINVIYTWAIENRIIEGVNQSPVQGLGIDSRPDERPPEILTIEQIRKLLVDAKSLEHAWYPVWVMALLTGMRNGELYALLWSDIDFQNKRITISKSYNTRMRAVKTTKSGKWRTVPISSELHSFLLELKAQAKGREHVLPRLSGWDEGRQADILRKFCYGIGIRSIRFHALRACFATQLLAHDVAPARVMKICGWEDLKTMQHYVRLAGVDEKGATEPLRMIPSDEACMGEVVRLMDFRASKK
jgi:integrase